MSYKGPIEAFETTISLLSVAAEQCKKTGLNPTPFFRNRKYIVRLLKKYRRYITLNKQLRDNK